MDDRSLLVRMTPELRERLARCVGFILDDDGHGVTLYPFDTEDELRAAWAERTMDEAEA